MVMEVFRNICLVVYFVYAIGAGFAVRESRELLKQDVYHRDGDTLYILLEICEPQSISVDGTTVSFDANDIGDCHSFKFLINACAMSLVFSMAAIVMYSILMILADYGRSGPIEKSTIVGMGLFLIFILLQTSVCVWALASQCRFWTDYFEQVYEQVDGSIDKVKTYGNQIYFWIVGGLALFCSVLLLTQATIAFCREKPRPPASEKSTMDGSFESTTEVVTPTSTSGMGRPPWTSAGA